MDKDKQLDRLLARGEVSGPERDRILERLLSRVEPPKQRAFPRWLVPVFAVPAVLAVALLFVQTETFRERGGRGARAILNAGCADACRVGATLVFSAARVREPGYLAGFGDCPGGIIWYFTDSPRVEPSEEAQVLTRGVRLDSRHEGQCTQHLWLTRRPLPRDALLSGPDEKDVLGALTQTLQVTP